MSYDYKRRMRHISKCPLECDKLNSCLRLELQQYIGMDEYLNSDHMVLYRTLKSGMRANTLTAEARAERMMERRKNARHVDLMKKRNIERIDITETASKIKSDAENKLEYKDKLRARMERLQKFKETKEKKLQTEKAQKKPIFKVCHVSHPLATSNTDNVYKHLKEKERVKDKQFKVVTDNVYNFAPPNHKFKPPSNIRKIPLSAKPKKSVEVTQRVTRSQALKELKREAVGKGSNSNNKAGTVKRSSLLLNVEGESKCIGVELNESKEEQKTLKGARSSKKSSRLIRQNAVISSPIDTKANKKDKRKSRKKLDVSSNSLKLPSESESIDELNKSVSSDMFNTPKRLEVSGVYISPFITMSRGKDAARKEFHERTANGGSFSKSPNTFMNTNDLTAATHFRRVLDDEINRLNGICSCWSQYKDEQNPPEEACDMINVAIGQSNLLIGKKFKQFRDLIDACEFKNTDTVVTGNDLHGYWEVAYIQVKNLNKRFENLEKLRENGWVEILPEVKVPKLKKITIKKQKIGASSLLKDVIKNARRNMGRQRIEQDEGTLPVEINNKVIPVERDNVEDPIMLHGSRCSIKYFDSSAKSILKETQKRVSSSGLFTVTVSQSSQEFEAEDITKSPLVKTILKVRENSSKSSENHKKSVLFDCSDSKENTPLRSGFIRRGTPFKKPPKLSLVKLF